MLGPFGDRQVSVGAVGTRRSQLRWRRGYSNVIVPMSSDSGKQGCTDLFEPGGGRPRRALGIYDGAN